MSTCAILNWLCWVSASGRPNCWRTFRWEQARSRLCWAAPRLVLAMLIRPPLSLEVVGAGSSQGYPAMAMLKPAPSCPIMFSTGTWSRGVSFNFHQRPLDLAVLKDDGPGGLAVPAHLLLLLPEAEALRALLHEETGDAPRAGAARPDHHQVHVGRPRAGDEGLAPVQDELASLPADRRLLTAGRTNSSF